jgi:hypothetical protein
VIRARVAIGLVCALAAHHSAAAQYRYQTVEFSDLLRAHVDGRLGIDRLTSMTTGTRITEPAVYVTATRKRILLYGETRVLLDAGRAPDEEIAVCSSGAPCMPRVRDAIADERARLGRALHSRPDILLLADHDLPYPTLLLLARSAAEAGAPLSIRVVGRRGPELVAHPVWVAPGRELLLSAPVSPAVIIAELDGGAAVVHSIGGYLPRPTVARSAADLIDILGRLELTTGRNTFFLAGGSNTTAGDIIEVLAPAREVFPNVVLQEWGARRAVLR